MSSRVVHKHDLTPAFSGPTEYPGHAVALVAAQDGRPCVWIERHVDSGEPGGSVWLDVVATGATVTVDGVHVGSFLMADGMLVWHVYRVGPR